LKRSQSIKPLYRGLLDTIEILLKRGQATGIFRSDVDAIDLYLSISGLAYFFLSNQHTLSWLLDRDLTVRRRLHKRRQHVVEVVLGYLLGPSLPGAKGRNMDAIRPEAKI
jgi:TetR/AcrR family transcriptional regulator